MEVRLYDYVLGVGEVEKFFLVFIERSLDFINGEFFKYLKVTEGYKKYLL